MAHSTPNLILALLLLNTACPAACASVVMRVHSTGELERMQGESVTDLASMFSDDLEAKAMTSKLLEEAPSDDLLQFVKKLKDQLQPWHDNSEESLKAAIAEVASCTGGMESDMRNAQAHKDTCSEKSISHTTHRTDENTMFTTKEHWKAEKAEKKEVETTECNAFDSVEEEAKAATASYSGGDVGAYLERVSAQFCNDLLPRYEEHKEKCTTAKAEHVTVSATYETKNTAYTVQKTASDTVQTEMDVACCEYPLVTKRACTDHDTCYEDKVASYNAVKAIVEAEEKVKKVEWRVYSRIECLLPVLGTDQASKIEECRATTHDTGHLDIDYPAIPAKSTCHVDSAFPGTDAYYATHFGALPENAKGKNVNECTGMMGDESAQFRIMSTCKEKSTSTADAGYVDDYRGWYDVQGCGKCLDYCRWVGNSGSGGNPVAKQQHGTSWWDCRLAGGSAPYSGSGHFSSWSYKKCSGEGAEAPL